MVPQVYDLKSPIVTTGVGTARFDRANIRIEESSNAVATVRTGAGSASEHARAMPASNEVYYLPASTCTTSFNDNETREDKLARYRAKKARRTCHRPRVMYESRKRTAEVKPRIRGRFVRPEQYVAYCEQHLDRPGMQGAGDTLHTVPTTTQQTIVRH